MRPSARFSGALSAVILLCACASAELCDVVAEASVPSYTPADLADYPWTEDLAEPFPTLTTLESRFDVPDGYTRVPVVPGSYEGWLRKLPIRMDRTDVLAYNGKPLARPSAAVVFLDVGNRDLMQCADSIIRLDAEYLWATGRADEAGYRFTSGDLSRWADWKAGERFIVSRTVKRESGEPRSSSHTSYRKWLDLIFMYAGTSSLARDAPTPPDDQPVSAGDFFVAPGFPGHAVIVLDVAVNIDGERVGLVGQGFMPAEDVHVLESTRAVDGHWFPLPAAAGDQLSTPSWHPFSWDARRRMR